MYGFGANKRIVLYDTLLAQCSERQVVAVLAHELGHWKLRHTAQLLVCHQAVVGAQLALFAAARGAPGLHAAFGFAPGARPALAALVIFQMLSAPLDEALGLLANLASRAFEFQADAFAAALGRGRDLRAALVALSKENKGPPNVDAWYSTYHFSHPRLPERLAAIQAAAKKSS
jgi:STE24 endopeptidase